MVGNMEEPKKQWRLAGLVTRGTILQTHEYYRGGAGFFGQAGAAGAGPAVPPVPPPNKVGRCRVSVSAPVLKAPLVSALEATI